MMVVHAVLTTVLDERVLTMLAWQVSEHLVKMELDLVVVVVFNKFYLNFCLFCVRYH